MPLGASDPTRTSSEIEKYRKPHFDAVHDHERAESGHAARPHSTREVMVAACATVMKPGCSVALGNGEDSAPLHNPRYDFNDAGLLHGRRNSMPPSRGKD